jgi:hypothetical protein
MKAKSHPFEKGGVPNLFSLIFQTIPGVPKIKDNYNPSTWMLEVTCASMEAQLGVDFAQIYRESTMCK